MAKFDPSRVTGGTIELVRNPDGSYKSQVTGFCATCASLYS